MKKLVLSISFLVSTILLNAQSPSFEWAKSIGGPTGTFNLTAVGGSDIFIDKLDGSQLFKNIYHEKTCIDLPGGYKCKCN